jgi:signal transduction histidine kinase
MQGGCGTSRSCRVCGAVDAIQECLNTNMKIVNECRITANQEDKEISYDFKVTASPFEYQGKRFVILSFEDISDEKRRQILERLFFHDIINTASGLRGFIEFMEMSNDPAEHKEYLTIASRLSDVLIEEIISQRQLLAAERGELKVNKVAVDINDLITETIQQIAHHQVAKTIPIVFVNAHENLNFTTDPVLLKRVLLNLLKNAVEASKPNQQVEIGFSTNNNNEVIISVKNDTIMSQEIQLQIFQRSFSTKGEARGIGTYSIKMFTEQYLGGKVSFVSNSTEKTVFSISLPLA